MCDSFGLPLAGNDLAELLYLIVISSVLSHDLFDFDCLLHDEVCLLDEVVGSVVYLEVKLSVYILSLKVQILLLSV